ncbi:restriction endonuclease subunit S [Microcoleus sp. Z1_A1]|uniref:restriction endonuclease subunit S n=1 Tax=Microcoleus sp. Z1_A1 TaxID=3055428 RepID=UPI002FD3F030
MSKWQKVKISDLLIRSKIPIEIEDQKEYKRVTIRTKHQGVSLRDKEIGKKIGTKKQFILKSGQFLMSKIDARYGAFGIAGDDVDGAIITGNFWAYDINHSLTTVEWINKYTNSPAFYDLCERASSGITHRKYLNEQIFLNHDLFIPLIDEQSTILFLNGQTTQLINNFNEELFNQEKYIDQLKQAILQEAISGQLTAEWRKQNPIQKGNPDTDAAALLAKIKAEKEQLIADGKLKKEKPIPEISPDEIPFSLPDSWVWCRLGEICDFITKGTTPSSSEFKDGGEIPYLKVYNIVNQKIDFYYKPQFIEKTTHQRLSRSKVYPGDVLMNIVGPPLGKIALVPDDFEEWNINQALAIFRCMKKSVNQYIYIFLNEGSEIKKIQTLGVVGQDNISLAQCRNMLIPLPPLAEQKAIVEKVDYLMKIIDELESQIKHRKQLAEDLMQTVLREAFE